MIPFPHSSHPHPPPPPPPPSPLQSLKGLVLLETDYLLSCGYYSLDYY